MGIIARPFAGRRDIDNIVHMIGASFGGGFERWHRARLRRMASDQYKNLRCLELDGRIVSFLEVVPKRMYIGRSLLRMAGIAGVCTDPTHRKKGYNRALLDDTVEFMKREDYDISILYGIPDYYHKYGYEVVMSRHLVTMARRDLPDGRLALKMSSIRKADLPALCRLYNAQARFRDGNCRRSSMRKSGRGFILCDSKGRAAAYACWHESEGTLSVRDAAARNAAAARELLLGLDRAAWRAAADHISVEMPFGYPLTDAMRHYDCVYRRMNRRKAGCMGRIAHLASLARSMQGEWTRLVGASEFSSKAVSLALAVGDETLSVSARRGAVTAAVTDAPAASRVTPETFAQMLLGYRDVGELADDRDVRFAAGDRRLLAVLFPERNSMIMGPDRF